MCIRDSEYWLGSLSASGDPAAACCCTIPELQNPDVNPHLGGQSCVVAGFDRDTGVCSLSPLASSPVGGQPPTGANLEGTSGVLP